MGLYFLDGDFTGLIARSERAAKQPQFHDHSLQSHRFAEGRKPNFQLDVRTHLSENGIVKGAEFERRIQKLARRMQVACQFVADKGKGSHGRLCFGEEYTTLKDRNKEIGRDLLAKMCRDLKIGPHDL